jgi:hypothetical protein
MLLQLYSLFTLPTFFHTFSFFSLPWQGLRAGNKKQKYDKISETKVSTSIEVIMT